MTEGKKQSLFSDHKTIGWIISIVLHLVLILFVLYLPFLQRNPLDRAYEGVLVSFGLPVETSSGEPNQSQKVEEEAEIPEMEEVKEENNIEELKSSLTEEDSPAIVAKEEDPKPAERKPARSEASETEKEENNLDQAKDAFSQFFNPSQNQGQNNQQSGDPLGEPDASILEGISRGKGRVGGGLDERGVIYEPEIVEHSQKSGRVVVRVCVDKSGKVISARYTQRGSTTTDRELVDIAELSAKKYKFLPSTEFEEQCGTISINFIVQ